MSPLEKSFLFTIFTCTIIKKFAELLSSIALRTPVLGLLRLCNFCFVLFFWGGEGGEVGVIKLHYGQSENGD